MPPHRSGASLFWRLSVTILLFSLSTCCHGRQEVSDQVPEPGQVEGVESLLAALGGMGIDVKANKGGHTRKRKGKNGQRSRGRKGQATQDSVCPAGQYPAPLFADDLRVVVNGCGPQGMQVQESYGLHRCCNQHDICYSLCGTTHRFCEKSFKQCMNKVCAEQDEEWQPGCERQATSFSGMTASMGAMFHRNGMQEGCQCMDSRPEALGRYADWLIDMYSRFDGEVGDEEVHDRVAKLLEQYKDKEGQLVFRVFRKFGRAGKLSPNHLYYDNVKEEL